MRRLGRRRQAHQKDCRLLKADPKRTGVEPTAVSQITHSEQEQEECGDESAFSCTAMPRYRRRSG